ncbi:HK97 family phage prohead protease [Pedobacter sp. MW01-1-1]|uniref:HK97 family phage prohead protease n=1 Tax=Pedobacter sp. MW01-1-1 TaxID=3383027 RepID=UPI003FF00B6F
MKKSTKTFKCSDLSQNVYGMTVKTEGIRIDDFLNNPVCLLNHNYDKVMGAWTDLAKLGTTLSGVPMFDTEDEEANKYYGQVERGVIKGASIGIIPLKVVGNEITESELLEISITPVPANRNALVLYNTKGQRLSAKEAKVYLLSVEKTEDLTPEFMNPKLLAALVTLCANAQLTVQLSATPTDDELVSAITGIGNKLTALQLSNTQLTSANAGYVAKEVAAKELEKTNVINLAVSEKRITEAQRETFSKLYDADPELCKNTLSALAPVNLSVIPGAKEAAAAAAATDEKANWTFDEYAEKAPVELSAMQSQKPDQFKKLYDAKVAVMRAAGAID